MTRKNIEEFFEIESPEVGVSVHSVMCSALKWRIRIPRTSAT